MLSLIKKELGKRKEKQLFQRNWAQSVTRYINFLKTVTINDFAEKKDERHIGVLVTPWMGLAVPWYAITIGLLFKGKGYSNITLIINDLWSKDDVLCPYYDMQVDSILKVLSSEYLYKYSFNILKLSDMPRRDLNDEETLICRLARLNTIKYLGNSIRNEKHNDILKIWIETYNKMGGRIKSCSELEWNSIIVPGGVFQETGLFLEFFKTRKVNVITYDAGPGSMGIGVNVCAAQYGNLKQLVEEILEEKNGSNLDIIKSKVKEIISNRMYGRPESCVNGNGDIIQKIDYKNCSDKNYDVVLFTNLEHDTAALGTHDIFEDDYSWIVETIRFVLDNTNATMAIRQHPMQKLFGDMESNEAKIKEVFKEEKRVVFINYNEEINSYSLIRNAKVIIVNTSTIGLEAAMFGKAVITDSHSYYSHASFMKYSNKKKDYFEDIVYTLRNKQDETEQKKVEAAIYYFLTQYCGWAASRFTSIPEDYEYWSQKTFGDLLQDKVTDYLLESVVEAKSLSKQIYNEMFL